MPSPYLPHVLYSLAITSVAINIVSAKKTIEEDRARVAARQSLLTQIHTHLASPTEPVPWDEVERLKRLARRKRDEGKSDEEKEREGYGDGRVLREVQMGWRDVFYGKRMMPREEGELSEWDKRDLEKLKQAFREEEEDAARKAAKAPSS